MKKLLLALYLILFASKVVFAVQMSDWGNYASSIQSCSIGTFNLPDPLQMNMSQPPLIITYKIIGWDAQGNCRVSIMRSITLPGEKQPRILTLDCLFPKDKLGFMSQSARQTAAGNVSITTENASNRLNDTYCK